MQQSIPMTIEAFERLVSGESPYHYEYIEGRVYDMTGSSPEHSALSMNLLLLFRTQLSSSGKAGQVYQNIYFPVPEEPPVAPDIVLTVDPADGAGHPGPFKVRSPLIVVDVFFPEVEEYVRGEKLSRYRCCPTLEACVLVNQHKPVAELYRRATNWEEERFSKGQIIWLEQPGLEIPLDEIYQGVH